MPRMTNKIYLDPIYESLPNHFDNQLAEGALTVILCDTAFSRHENSNDGRTVLQE